MIALRLFNTVLSTLTKFNILLVFIDYIESVIWFISLPKTIANYFGYMLDAGTRFSPILL